MYLAIFYETLGNNNAKSLHSEYDLRWSTLENSLARIKFPTVSAFFISTVILEIELKY
jgi:hypothetical protein